MPSSIKISYLYRDGSNYKQFGAVILANPSSAKPADIYANFVSAFQTLQLHPDVIHFQPALLGWDDLFFSDHDPVASDDLDLHELESITITDEIPSAAQTIADLANSLAELAQSCEGKGQSAGPHTH